MNPLLRGLPTGQKLSPTLRAVRRMKNLSAGLREISRRPVGVDGFPYEAFLDPLSYMRWNPNLLDAYPDLNPLKTIQESLIESPIPDATEAFRVERRNIERGTVENRVIEREITRELKSNLDRHFSDRGAPLNERGAGSTAGSF